MRPISVARSTAPRPVSRSARHVSGLESSADFTGAESDLDAMMQKAAERLYGITQPFYRYGAYLGPTRPPRRIGHRLSGAHWRKPDLYRSALGPITAWRVNTDDHDIDVLARLFGRAVELDPTNALATVSNLSGLELTLGHTEQALADARTGLALLSSKEQGQIRQDYIPSYRQDLQSRLDQLLGDFRSATLELGYVVQSGLSTGTGISGRLAHLQADAHDIGAAPRNPGRSSAGSARAC